MSFDRIMTRRDALGCLGAGAALVCGLWPGTLRAQGRGSSGAFRFLAINDTHCMSPECGEYLTGVVRQMKAEDAAFCLLAGDLTERGDRHWMETVKDIFKELGCPMYPVIGNHDHRNATDCRAYQGTFPGRINYLFEHRGWQFVGLDSTQGQQYAHTAVQPATFRWLADNLPRLDRSKPIVLFTHFPLGSAYLAGPVLAHGLWGLTVRDLSASVATLEFRPTNADALLDQFRDFDLRAAFSGHYHAFTECRRGPTVLTTDRCCSLRRTNHDGTKEKGYFVCDVRDGQLHRRFVRYPTPAGLAMLEGKL